MTALISTPRKCLLTLTIKRFTDGLKQLMLQLNSFVSQSFDLGSGGCTSVYKARAPMHNSCVTRGVAAGFRGSELLSWASLVSSTCFRCLSCHWCSFSSESPLSISWARGPGIWERWSSKDEKILKTTGVLRKVCSKKNSSTRLWCLQILSINLLTYLTSCDT